VKYEVEGKSFRSLTQAMKYGEEQAKKIGSTVVYEVDRRNEMKIARIEHWIAEGFIPCIRIHYYR